MQQSFRHYPFSISKMEILYWNMQTFDSWLDLLKTKSLIILWICRLMFIFLNMQTRTFLFSRLFADLLFYFSRLVFFFLNMQTFCRLFLKTCFFIFADLLLNMQTFCRHFADLFFYDFWIGFLTCQLPNYGLGIELFSENLWKHILVFWKVFKW